MTKARTTAKTAERWALPAQQARSRATRARILAAAEKAFGEKGYGGTHIAGIAETAGCSVGAVYFRFKDKDALFFAIAETFAAEARERLSGLIAPDAGRDVKETIRGFVQGTAANFRAHKGMFRAIVECGFDHPQAMKTVLNLRDEMAVALERRLRAQIPGRQTEELALAVRVLTQMVYGFLLTGVLNARAPTKIGDPRALGEVVAAAIAYLDAKGFLA